ncbi:hypothetical protein [Streptomyces acidiscabies]|uniref:Uncharacterized protein n=1 Tax=Streptomyces acidiscabies TaxID=42234 RepID=A0ABU4LWY4_9ACTN|nr:hypothetical protein [Streptomyces acidiscabies]MDX3020071.1 hypothetical protein [Streptomyces acidiscabies]
MDRIYMNRTDGQRRIHIEIHDNEVSDLIDDLTTDPEPFAATLAFLEILRTAEEKFSPAVAEGRRERAARQAAGQAAVTLDRTTTGNPTPLRWGLGDVLHGDDDIVTVCLSGPDREPYRLELDPEHAAALRDDLATPRVVNPACSSGDGIIAAFAVGQPAGTQDTGQACIPRAAAIVPWHQANGLSMIPPAAELRAAAQTLRQHADAAEADIDSNPVWRSALTDRSNWYANGVRNGLGGPAGELAALMSPEPCRALAELLDDQADAADEGIVNPWALALARALNGDR